MAHLIVPPAVQDDDPGTSGNTRLTSTTGMVLTLLLLVEGFTVLDVRGYITLHTVLGLVLIGPVALKTLTVLYRFARYYTGRPAYVRHGPPPPVLRVIGPLVVLSTAALLGTGLILLSDHGDSDTWVTLHQASFIVWISLTGVHFLAHLVQAGRETAHEVRGRSGPAGRTRALRLLAVAGSLAVGIALAAAFTPSASSWQLHHDHRPGHVRPPG